MANDGFFDILFADPFDLNFDGVVTPEEEATCLHEIALANEAALDDSHDDVFDDGLDSSFDSSFDSGFDGGFDSGFDF